MTRPHFVALAAFVVVALAGASALLLDDSDDTTEGRAEPSAAALDDRSIRAGERHTAAPARIAATGIDRLSIEAEEVEPAIEPGDRGAAAPDGALTLEVVDATGAPAAGADVELAVADDGPGEKIVRGTTGADGLAVLRVPAGRAFAASASRPGARSRPCAPLFDGDRARLVLESELATWGRVVDADTGAALAGALLVAELDGVQTFTNSASDGTFRFAAARAAALRIEVLAPGHARVRLAVAPSAEPHVVELGEGGAIAGLVVDRATGGPVAGARVEAIARRTVGPSRLALRLAETTCDSTGRFVLQGVPADGFFVVARCEFGQVGVEISEPAPGGMLRLEVPRCATLSGRVLDAAGRPAAAARVLLVDHGAFDAATRKVRCDENGVFSIDAVRGDRPLRLVATADGATPAIVTLGGVPDAPIEISLAPADRIEGSVVDADGRAAPGATVELSATDRAAASAARVDPITIADANGGFEFVELPPGRYRLAARTRDGASAPVDVDVVAGGSASARLVIARRESLAGVVLDALDRPIAGAAISVTPDGADDDTGCRPRFARSDDTGSFVVRGLERGRHSVAIDAESFAAERLVAEVPQRETLVVRLVAEFVVTGRVVDAVTAEPIRAFSLRVDAADQGDGESGSIRKTSVSSPDGTFALTGLPRRDLFLTVRAPERRSEGPLRLDPDRFAPLYVQLEPAVEIAGRLRDGAGSPVTGARVFARRAGGDASELLATARSAADGGFRLRDLAPGSLEIGVGDPTAPAALVGPIDAAPGGAEVGDVRVDARGRVRIQIDGVDAPRQLVLRGVRSKSRVERPAANGAHSIEPLIPDEYVISLEGGDRPEASRRVDVRPGMPATVRIGGP